jgi:hypothetical protein
MDPQKKKKKKSVEMVRMGKESSPCFEMDC